MNTWLTIKVSAKTTYVVLVAVAQSDFGDTVTVPQDFDAIWESERQSTGHVLNADIATGEQLILLLSVDGEIVGSASSVVETVLVSFIIELKVSEVGDGVWTASLFLFLLDAEVFQVGRLHKRDEDLTHKVFTSEKDNSKLTSFLPAQFVVTKSYLHRPWKSK